MNPGRVLVEDRQETVALDTDRWVALAGGVLEAEGVAPDVELGLAFVEPGEMADLNRRFLGGDGPTDVLAFPLDSPEGSVGPALLGDVVVCPAVAAENAPGHAGSLDDELALLVVHGALHVLGHDHAEGQDRRLMRDRERALLARFYGPLTADPWAET